MNRPLTALSLLALLAACDNYEPFFTEVPDQLTEEELPPGTEDPTEDSDIVRFEERNDIGGGYAESIDYNAANDTFLVDNLPFDGENVFQRGAAVAQLNSDGVAAPGARGYAVYDADITVPDFLTSGAVDQIVPYRAIRGVSSVLNDDGTPRTSFAIVRTGGYGDYGFGGWTYNRSGPVILPTTGQAQWEGDYAGLRIYTGAFIGDGDRDSLEYTTGDMIISIDTDDFNSTGAVKGRVFNRQRFDRNGNPLPVGTFQNFYADGLPSPDINFVISEGTEVLNEDGELAGRVINQVVKRGNVVDYEVGNYYAVVAGDTTTGDGGEIAGVIVVQSEDYFIDGLFAQETGGYILPRAEP